MHIPCYNFYSKLCVHRAVVAQVLGSACLGQIQLGLNSRKGCLEVEVIRARGLVPKTSTRLLPGLSLCPGHATPCHVTPHHATPHHATPHHAAPCHTTPRHATLRHAMPHYATPCHTTPCHTTPHHTTPHHTTPHHPKKTLNYPNKNPKSQINSPQRRT